ncbi:MAG: tetratricopeptide repeat protein [Bryobacteraceae bacterium]
MHPPEAAGTLADLRMAPDDIDEQLLRLFVPRAAEIDQEKDFRLAAVAKIIAESASVHNAATYAMEQHPWDFMGIYYPSIDHFSHGFMNYHPPRPEWIRESDFELYKDVVSSGYRLHDLFLGRLLQLAPSGTTVILCSDHGFHSDHLRPREIPQVPAGPAEQHRPLGILAMAGPGIKKDEIIYGATLLDIAPTVLHLCGLPAGRDMPGRILLEAMEDPRPEPRIPSWEDVEGEAGMHQGAVAMSAGDAEALIEQFVALGYIDKPSEDAGKEAQKCERERMWNLARVYLHSQRPHLALPLLEQIWDETPDRTDFALVLAGCQARLGMVAEARATAEEAIAGLPPSAAQASVLATVAALSGGIRDALAHLEEATRLSPASADIAVRHGAVLLALRRWAPAEMEFLRATAIDPHHPQAWESLALARLRLKKWTEAAEAALESAGFDFHRPRAHMFLGIALYQLGRHADAIRALETALGFRPPLRQAHFWLSRVLMRIPGRQEDALRHRERARLARERRLDHRDRLHRLHDEAAVRAASRTPNRAERRTEALAEREKMRARRKDAIAKAQREAEVLRSSAARPLDLIVVSGLPRSGTSVMMQMLHGGGIPVMTDNERQADSDNPRGYLEWEAVKKLETEPDILYQAEGKAIKVISALLPFLPVTHRYKVIFMDRPIDEVAASHDKMIHNRGEKKPSTEPSA